MRDSYAGDTYSTAGDTYTMRSITLHPRAIINSEIDRIKYLQIYTFLPVRAVRAILCRILCVA